MYGGVSGYGYIDGELSWLSGNAVLSTASRSSDRVSLPSARKMLPGIGLPSATTCPGRWPTLASPMAWRTWVSTVPKMPAVYGVAADVPPKAHWPTVAVRHADGRLPSPQALISTGMPSPTIARSLSRRIAPTVIVQSFPVSPEPEAICGTSNGLPTPLPAANSTVCPRSAAALVSSSGPKARPSGTPPTVPKLWDVMSTHGKLSLHVVSSDSVNMSRHVGQ